MKRRRLRRQLELSLSRLQARVTSEGSRDALELVVSAMVIGALAGVAAVGFDVVVRGMEGAEMALRGTIPPAWAIVAALAIPALGGLLVAPVVVRWAPEVRGSGIPSVMYAVSNLAGRVRRRVALWRPLASAISIGSGASLGTEGPVVQLAASLASTAGGWMRLSEERRRNLLAVAAAGGISATFNAPIAGMLFALEVILGEFGSRYVASVVVGSVTASVVSRAFLGPDPAFAIPEYGLGSPAELPLYALLAVAMGLAAAGFIRLTQAAEGWLDRLAPPALLRPALAGLLVGGVGLALPAVLGRGFAATGAILQGEMFGIGFLLALALAKALATALSLAGWFAGGVFAPILMIGAALGGAFGTVLGGWLPGWGLQPGAFALVGMAALLAGATRAPMSSLLVIFEMSSDYRLILPLLLGTVLALLVAELASEESIYHAILTRRGQTLQRLRAGDILQTVRVREIMDREAPALLGSAPLSTLEMALAATHHHGFAVVAARSDGVEDLGAPGAELLGIVTVTDLERARLAGVPADASIASIATTQLVTATPDERVADVIERMARAGVGRVPVVDARERTKLLGFVRRTSLSRAYYQAVQREREMETVAEERRLRELTGQEIVQVAVRPGCPVAGLELRQATLPAASIVVAIRRGGRTVFPHGDTRLEPGDVVIANVAPGFEGEFRALFGS